MSPTKYVAPSSVDCTIVTWQFGTVRMSSGHMSPTEAQAHAVHIAAKPDHTNAQVRPIVAGPCFCSRAFKVSA